MINRKLNTSVKKEKDKNYSNDKNIAYYFFS